MELSNLRSGHTNVYILVQKPASASERNYLEKHFPEKSRKTVNVLSLIQTVAAVLSIIAQVGTNDLQKTCFKKT